MFHPPPRYCRTSCLDHLVVIIGLHLTVVPFTNYVLLSDFASRASFTCLDRLVVILADVTSRVCRFEILNLLRVQLQSDVARSCGKQTFFFSLCRSIMQSRAITHLHLNSLLVAVGRAPDASFTSCADRPVWSLKGVGAPITRFF